LAFDKWTGQPLSETFGGKPIVSFDNKPMFAELAIVNHFSSYGWDARWMETYGRGKKGPICLSAWKDDKYKNQIHNPILTEKIVNLCASIGKANCNSYSGCWDVLARKDDHILFAESKRAKKDKIRQTQNNWLAAAFACGLSTRNFLVVQWDIKE